MNPTDRPTRTHNNPDAQKFHGSISSKIRLQAGGWEGIRKNLSLCSGCVLYSMPTRLAVGLRQSDLNQSLDIRPEILRSTPGSPFSSCLFDEPKAKKKLGYMNHYDRAEALSSQDIHQESALINNGGDKATQNREVEPIAKTPPQYGLQAGNSPGRSAESSIHSPGSGCSSGKFSQAYSPKRARAFWSRALAASISVSKGPP